MDLSVFRKHKQGAKANLLLYLRQLQLACTNLQQPQATISARMAELCWECTWRLHLVTLLCLHIARLMQNRWKHTNVLSNPGNQCAFYHKFECSLKRTMGRWASRLQASWKIPSFDIATTPSHVAGNVLVMSGVISNVNPTLPRL